MGNHTQLRAVNRDGDQIHVNQTITDSPILPAENIRALAEVDPRFVDFVLTQTEKEADFRRSEMRRTNRYIFTERISGVIAGALVAIIGLGISGVLIFLDHDWAGTLLGGATLATIVTVLVTKGVSGQAPEQEKPPQKRNRQKK